MKLFKSIIILYTISIVASLNFYALSKDIDGKILTIGIGIICFLAGLLFDINILKFLKKKGDNHEREDL